MTPTAREQRLELAIREHERKLREMIDNNDASDTAYDRELWSVLPTPPPEERTCETCIDRLTPSGNIS